MPNHFKVSLLLLVCGVCAGAADFRLGIIGTDTSHVPVFTREFNDSTAPGFVPGFRVVAAWKGGSPDIPDSATRVDGFANELHDTVYSLCPIFPPSVPWWMACCLKAAMAAGTLSRPGR